MSIEQKVEKLGRRVKTVEDAIVLLTALTDSHNDRLFDLVIEEENLNEKVSALVDAQIRTEEVLNSLRQKSMETEEKISILIDMQIKSVSEIEKLHNFSKEVNEKLEQLKMKFEN